MCGTTGIQLVTTSLQFMVVDVLHDTTCGTLSLPPPSLPVRGRRYGGGDGGSC